MIPDWLAKEVAEYDISLKTPPKTVLDIGANIGAFTLRAAKRWPTATVIACEPMLENIEQFKLNCANVNCKLIPAAIANFTGKSNMFVGDQFVTNSFHKLGRQTDVTIDVNCLDAATLPSADYVKIDTEGCEVEILERLNLTETKALAVEYHCVEDGYKIRALAEKAGLKFLQHIPADETTGVVKFGREGFISDGIKLFVGVPVYGAMEANFAQCLIDLHLNPPCDEFLVCKHLGDSLVSRARNTITAKFLETDATHLMWIDSDLIFSPEHVKRLISHGKELVGGFYPKKCEGRVQWVVNAIDGGVDAPVDPETGLQEIKYAGTGFMLIARTVFEQMIEKYGDKIRFKADESGRIEHDFWSVGVYDFPDGTRRYLSEDWYFCQRWLDLGGKIWGDTKIVAKHVGTAVYPLKTQEADLRA